MKLLLILICLPICAMAQKQKITSFNILPEVDGVVMYTGVITLDSTVSKLELFNRAKAWFVNEYKSANDVIQMEDKDAGVLMGKGIGEAPYSLGFIGSSYADISHTVKIYVKGGRYKYEITGFSGKYKTENGFNDIDIDNTIPLYNKNRKEKILVAANKEMIAIVESLKTGMNKPIMTKDF